MNDYQHPLRTAPLEVYERVDGEKWIAHFSPWSNYPIFFNGSTREDVEGKANDFRDENADRHEAAFVQRAQAKEARGKKNEQHI